MDRRSLLKMFGVAAAAATVIVPTMANAMPTAPRPGGPATPAPAVATDADLEAVQPEKTYWGWRRRRFYRRRFYGPRFHRRRYFFRPRRFYRRRFFY